MKKEQILEELLMADGYLSGEELGRKMNCTRAAVSGIINKLRDEGYTIDSVTNRGYRLTGTPNVLTQELVAAHLDPERAKTVLVLPEIDSTNKYLKKLADEGAPDGQIVIADCQTRGRGRMGREFYSPKNKGIYFSMLMRPDILPEQAFNVTPCAAVATARAIEKTAGVSPAIKWVNDLLLGGKKIVGILTEMTLEAETGRVGSIICGIGINVLEEEEDFSEELRGIAGSIKTASGIECSRAALAAALIEEMDVLREGWLSDRASFLDAYRSRCATRGPIVIHDLVGHKKTADALGIGDDFSLRVRYENGTEEYVRSGEVSIRAQGGGYTSA